MIAWWWFGVFFARSSKKEPFSFEPPRRNFDFFTPACWLAQALPGGSLARVLFSLLDDGCNFTRGPRKPLMNENLLRIRVNLLPSGKMGPPLRMHGWQHKARCWFEMKSFILSKSEAFRRARCGGCRLSCYQSTVIFFASRLGTIYESFP